MIKKIMLINLLASISSIYCASIENIENKETTHIDILYSDILIAILSNVNKLSELNELLGKFRCSLPKNSWFLSESEELNYEAVQIINKYLEIKLKEDFKKEKHEKYYSALKGLATKLKYKNILTLLSLAKIDPPIYEIDGRNMSEANLILLFKIARELNFVNMNNKYTRRLVSVILKKAGCK